MSREQWFGTVILLLTALAFYAAYSSLTTGVEPLFAAPKWESFRY